MKYDFGDSKFHKWLFSILEHDENGKALDNRKISLYWGKKLDVRSGTIRDSWAKGAYPQSKYIAKLFEIIKIPLNSLSDDGTTDSIIIERDLYRELAEERKKRIDMLENDNRNFKEQFIQTITNPLKRYDDAEDFDPASLRCQVLDLFNEKL